MQKPVQQPLSLPARHDMESNHNWQPYPGHPAREKCYCGAVRMKP